jgi:hypothetical protein
MATSSWFSRATGNTKNSGGHDSDTARVTRDSGTNGVITGTTTFTDVGATFVTSGVLVTDAVNIQVAGVDSIYEIVSVDSETQLTLAAGPADASYDYRIGGARNSVKKNVATGAGNNLAVASADSIGIKGGTYTENAVTNVGGLRWYSSDGVEWVIDGTGGAAGSDCITTFGTGTMRGGAVVNAVDEGVFFNANGGMLVAMRAQACGDNGFELNSRAVMFEYCKALSNTTIGFAATSAVATYYRCTADGNGSHGIGGSTGAITLRECLLTDNAGDGCNISGAAAIQKITGNTFEGNTGDGIELANTGALALGAFFVNNLVTNNANGVNSSGGAQTNGYYTDYNDFFGNSTARVNWNTGTNDIATDPQYVSAATDDYTPGAAAVARGGLSGFGTTNKVPIGAVAGPAAGGQASQNDVRFGTVYGPASEYTGNMTLPNVNDVRNGTDYGTSGTEFDGDLVLPDAADVKSGTGFGADGTEYTGTFAQTTGGGSRAHRR